MKTQLSDTLEESLLILKQQGEFNINEIPPIHIERARGKEYGDYASNIAMVLGKSCGKNPRDVAQAIIKTLPKKAFIQDVQIAGPGFINFFLTNSAHCQSVIDALTFGDTYGHCDLGAGQSVHMELVSSNPTGPLHVGHGRLAAYGSSLSNVLDAAGYKVHREYYVNDAGRQMHILTASIWLRYLELYGNTLTFPLNGYQGDYVMDIAKALKVKYEDKFCRPIVDVFRNLPKDTEETKETYIDALITRMKTLLYKEDYQLIFTHGLDSILGDIREDLLEFRVDYQAWYHESELHHPGGEIEKGIKILRDGGHLYERDGATWFRATDFGDDKDRVVIRENGEPTYFAADVGYHLYKFKHYDTVLDIFGADHHGYGPRLMALYKAAGENPDRLKIAYVQFATLFRGKTKVSMSTRGGQFVTLRELREEVGNDAARFFYVMRKHEQHLEFDLELAKAHSNENPVYYIQYAHARICSVFRQLEHKGFKWDQKAGLAALDLLSAPHEQDLMRLLSRYPETLKNAAEQLEPSFIAQYLQDLANGLHSYYNAEQFIVDDAKLRNARFCLIAATKMVLASGLTLLGVSTPESM